ncbi:MAG: DEAD/DEAH box helicase, partial [Planctomycetota bacterium]
MPDPTDSAKPEPGADPKPSAFERLHPKVQEELYAMRWTELRPIQEDTIHEVFTGTGPILIAAQTASGKTEAAFLPILSQAIDAAEPGVHTLYIGPLKALINDQFRRVEELCKRTEISVNKWHGDVGVSAKDRLLKTPRGVLLITPESTESLFINKPQLLGKLFSQLQFIVIDELHSFMGTERGAHLKSLLYRLDDLSRHPVRLLGLSATIGDLEAAGRWLTLRKEENAALIEDDHDTKIIKYRIHGYLIRKVPSNEKKDEGGAAADAPGSSEAETRMIDDLYNSFKGNSALIFGNSKSKLEFYADKVIQKARRNKTPHSFGIHHGSLSKAMREEVEQDLREKEAMAVFCSSTLEMGIDVGNISITGQIGAPWSVSSLVQRLGRSGRKEGQPSVMRMYIDALEPDEDSDLFDRLYPPLLSAVAMSELMLEGWCEPPRTEQMHLSCLVHQILSVIAQYGGMRADALYTRLAVQGAFRNVDRKLFIRVLKSLGPGEMVEQTPEGDLILGLAGEKLARSFDFYSVFQSPEEYSVVSNGASIGSLGLTASIVEGAFVILAGRRWKIEKVDTDKRVVLVKQARGGRLPYFPGAGGCDLHPKVHAKMRQLLFSDDLPAYLDVEAGRMLQHAREAARALDLEKSGFIQNGSRLCWFTWAGSRINRTLWVYGSLIAGLKVNEEELGLTFQDATKEAVIQTFQRFVDNPPGLKK